MGLNTQCHTCSISLRRHSKCLCLTRESKVLWTSVKSLTAWDFRGIVVLRNFQTSWIRRRKDSIKGLWLFCQVTWSGHSPSLGSTYRCLCLGQVSTSCPVSCVECQSYMAKRETIFLQKKKKKRNISDGHFETTCTIQVSKYWTGKKISQKYPLLSKYQVLVFSMEPVVSKCTESF